MKKTIASHDWVHRSAGHGRVERIEAYFSGHGYTPHRHDTYAIGFTLAGVQRFHYRRAQRHSLPGTVMVLHPDEQHDGEAGTDAGFRYRMLYVEPSLIQQILGGQALPFVDGGLSNDSRLQTALTPLLSGMNAAIDPLEEDEALYDLAHALVAIAGRRQVRRLPDLAAIERARSYMLESIRQTVSLDDLAETSGLDRWQLCRDFRTLYGTSPYRYLTMRRLDLARRLMVTGHAIAEAALAAGFSDQSHMTRRFASAFGVTPSRWLKQLGRTERAVARSFKTP